MSCQQCDPTKASCGDEATAATPLPVANAPGLPSLRYRVGTHGAFLETMKARLATMTVAAEDAEGRTAEVHPLEKLTTRDTDDPSIALLDGWATIGDVLSFYQERIANEGYLRTATERRSMVELARLVGYTPRPGVSATAYLAFTVDEDRSSDPPQPRTTTIPKGTRTQSVPDPGETPQTFETAEELEACSSWNALRPRVTEPQTAETVRASSLVYLQGTRTNLQVNDALLLQYNEYDPAVPMRVAAVTPEPLADRTKVALRAWGAAGLAPKALRLPAAQEARAVEAIQSPRFSREAEIPSAEQALLDSLLRPASLLPLNALRMKRSVETLAATGGDFRLRFLARQNAELGQNLLATFAHSSSGGNAYPRVYAFRATAGLFGHNAAAQKVEFTAEGATQSNWLLNDVLASEGIDPATGGSAPAVFLDSNCEHVLPGTWVLVDSTAVSSLPDRLHVGLTAPLVTRAANVAAGITRSEYGLSGKSTRIQLADPWMTLDPPPTPMLTVRIAATNAGASAVQGDALEVIRRTTIYAQPEELPLAEAPIESLIGTVSKTEPPSGAKVIELDRLLDGLEPGRWLIVTGERAEPETKGLVSAERAMLAKVAHGRRDIVLGPDAALAGDTPHTFLELAQPLAHVYRRGTLAIHANVVKATHGETRTEVLGSGDGSRALQTFTLKQPPLTFVPANVPAGVVSTLDVQVNDISWSEVDTLAGHGPRESLFVTRTSDAGETSVVFGNGAKGARLPTGVENVKAVYRSGIGRAGNVRAGQIRLLLDRPLGVERVLNPLRGSGGADAETRDEARENAPLAVMALDRLVSLQDYADFSRTFAGIGKAAAARLSKAGRELVHVTIAGAGDAPIDPASDLHQMLLAALRQYGDPDLAVQVDARELQVLVLGARIRIAPKHHWEPVVTEVRQRLLERFGFARRSLGQPVTLSEIVSVIQSASGVDYVDVDAFGAIPEKKSEGNRRRLLTPSEIATAAAAITGQATPQAFVSAALAGLDPGGVRPAELAIFLPSLPETLVLNPIQ